MKSQAGDACQPPESITNERFDLVFSNSVIEHVGGHRKRREFAYWVAMLGTHFWVQTPNRYFPIEPHFLFPGLQFLPGITGAKIARRWPLSGIHNRTVYDAAEAVLNVELLSATQFQHYFPEADLIRERYLGMTKSLVATR